MLTPIDDDPPVKGPSTPINIGSAANARPVIPASATTLASLVKLVMNSPIEVETYIY